MGSCDGIGIIPVIVVEADNLCQAWHEAMFACWQNGIRVETPKHQPGQTLGYDAEMIVIVNCPEIEPSIHIKGITDTAEGLESYRLEVIYGLYDHWVGRGWDYTYHRRIGDQIDWMIERIKQDFHQKDRMTGRDYQVTTWIPAMDQIIDDPPCLQRMHFRVLKDKTDSEFDFRLNLSTDWRSRDLFKAWLMNVWAITDWQRLLAKRLADELGVSIGVGRYIDHSNSLHLYGSYFEQDGLANILRLMEKKSWEDFAMKSNEFLTGCSNYGFDTVQDIRRFLAAQRDFDQKTGTKRAIPDTLKEAGYDLENYPYPPEWDE